MSASASRDDFTKKVVDAVSTPEASALGGAAVFGTVGGIAGSSVGIAALGTAIAGTIPIALGAAAIGGLGVYAARLAFAASSKSSDSPDSPDAPAEKVDISNPPRRSSGSDPARRQLQPGVRPSSRR